MISPPCPSTFGRRSIDAFSAVCSRGTATPARASSDVVPPSSCAEQRGEQVLRLDVAVVVAERQALGVGQRLLELGGQFVEAHGEALVMFDLLPKFGKTPHFQWVLVPERPAAQ